MAATISKIGILVGLDTTGLAGGAAKAENVISGFGEKISSIGHDSSGEFKLVSAFKAASHGLGAMEGSLAGMGSSMAMLAGGGFVMAGIAAEIAALFAAAKFSAWGISLAMGQDAEFTGKWKVFKDELADLALKIGELFMPLIKWWLDVGIAAVRALKGGTRAESGTYDRLTNPNAPDGRKKVAFDTLAIEESLLEKYRQQHKQIEETLRRRKEEMQHHADAITKSLRTPAEVLQDSLVELNTLMDANMISFQTYSRGIEKAADDFANLNDKARELQKIQTRTINPTALERGSSAEISARNRVESIIQAQADTAKQQLATQQRQEKLEQQIRDILKANNVTFQPINLR